MKKTKTIKSTKAKKANVNSKVGSKIISNKVGALLKEMDMTQTELSKKCKTNVAHISRIVNQNLPYISLPLAMRISKVLGQPIEKIFQLA